MYCTIGLPVQLFFSPILLKFGVHTSLWHISGSQKKHLFKKMNRNVFSENAPSLRFHVLSFPWADPASQAYISSLILPVR
jgi:hypothetical protein